MKYDFKARLPQISYFFLIEASCFSLMQNYLTFDGNNLCFFDEDGHKQGSFQAIENINRVVFSSQTNQFVGYMCGQEHLYVSIFCFTLYVYWPMFEHTKKH